MILKPSAPILFFIWEKWASVSGLVMVSAGFSEDGVALQALHQVLDVGYLEELSEHEGFEVPFGVVFDGSSGSFCVEVFPECGMDGS